MTAVGRRERVPVGPPDRSERLTYRPKELPALLGVSRTQVYAWLKSGVIPSVTIGSTVLIPKADFEAWLASLQRRSRGA